MGDAKKAKKGKKINQLKLADCERIIKELGGQDACTYVQHVMDRYQHLLAAKRLSKD